MIPLLGIYHEIKIFSIELAMYAFVQIHRRIIFGETRLNRNSVFFEPFFSDRKLKKRQDDLKYFLKMRRFFDNEAFFSFQ